MYLLGKTIDITSENRATNKDLRDIILNNYCVCNVLCVRDNSYATII